MDGCKNNDVIILIGLMENVNVKHFTGKNPDLAINYL